MFARYTVWVCIVYTNRLYQIYLIYEFIFIVLRNFLYIYALISAMIAKFIQFKLINECALKLLSKGYNLRATQTKWLNIYMKTLLAARIVLQKLKAKYIETCTAITKFTTTICY